MNPDEKVCPFCGETIKSVAVLCKHCKQSITHISLSPKNQHSNVAETRNESRKLARQGASTALFNYDSAETVGTEILIIAIIVGVYQGSWIIFGGTIVVLGSLMFIPILNYVFAVSVSIFWGYCGYLIGGYFSSNAQLVIAGIFGLFSIAIHISAIQYANDIQDNS